MIEVIIWLLLQLGYTQAEAEGLVRASNLQNEQVTIQAGGDADDWPDPPK